jgi:hypothetical protein
MVDWHNSVRGRVEGGEREKDGGAEDMGERERRGRRV